MTTDPGQGVAMLERYVRLAAFIVLLAVASGVESAPSLNAGYIYGAERDDLTPVRYHAERLAKALPGRATYVQIEGAGHFSFIASFPRAVSVWVGEAGRDPAGFDRDAMHATLNRDIAAFFDRTLRSIDTAPDRR